MAPFVRNTLAGAAQLMPFLVQKLASAPGESSRESRSFGI